jgi:hypothetical protein
MIIDQAVAMEHSLGPEVVVDPYHIGVIRAALNRNLASCYPDIQDEVVQSFAEVLALDGQGTSALSNIVLCTCSVPPHIPPCRLEGDACHECYAAHRMPC